MIVLSCRLLSSGSFVLTGLGFQVVVRLVGSVGRFEVRTCELRIARLSFDASKLRERIYGSA